MWQKAPCNLSYAITHKIVVILRETCKQKETLNVNHAKNFMLHIVLICKIQFTDFMWEPSVVEV